MKYTNAKVKIETNRYYYALDSIKELNLPIIHEETRYFSFMYKGSKITFYPFTGWATGKTIKDGRGLSNLLKQIKNNY